MLAIGADRVSHSKHLCPLYPSSDHSTLSSVSRWKGLEVAAVCWLSARLAGCGTAVEKERIQYLTSSVAFLDDLWVCRHGFGPVTGDYSAVRRSRLPRLFASTTHTSCLLPAFHVLLLCSSHLRLLHYPPTSTPLKLFCPPEMSALRTLRQWVVWQRRREQSCS